MSLIVTQADPATPVTMAAAPADAFGATVPHLLHEGLTRVDADAVLGGMGQATSTAARSVRCGIRSW